MCLSKVKMLPFLLSRFVSIKFRYKKKHNNY